MPSHLLTLSHDPPPRPSVSRPASPPIFCLTTRLPAPPLSSTAAGSTLPPHEAVLFELRAASNRVLGKDVGPASMLPAAAHSATVCCVRFR